MLIAALSKTPEREKLMAFSKPYKVDHQGMLVSNAAIKSLADLKNKRVGVVKGATSRRRIEEKFPLMKIVAFENYYQAMLALSIGDVDGVSADKSILTGMVALWNAPRKKLIVTDGDLVFWVDLKSRTESSKRSDLKILDNNLSDEVYVIGVSKEHASWLKDVNAFLDQRSLEK